MIEWRCGEYQSDVFFFKQKTAYELRISDWSSDVCSSDLHQRIFARAVDARRADHRFDFLHLILVAAENSAELGKGKAEQPAPRLFGGLAIGERDFARRVGDREFADFAVETDRKRVVEGKSVHNVVKTGVAGS